jgi:hypothetical protein
VGRRGPAEAAELPGTTAPRGISGLFIYFCALGSRSFRCVIRAILPKLVAGSLRSSRVGLPGGAAAYGVRVLAKTLFVGSEKFGHGENSVQF